MSVRDPEAQRIVADLSAPFDPKEVKFKPQMVKNNRCLAMPYIDARLVQDRLDDVLGSENWQDRYAVMADGSVACTLRLFLGGRWIAKVDVGSPSEQPDGGDRMKAAFSDALKRAAVKFGIGRYLYRIPSQWVDYDPVKKRIVQPPELPAFARPGAAKPATPKPPAPAPAPKPPAPALPVAREDTAATLEWLLTEYGRHHDCDAEMVLHRLCAAAGWVGVCSTADLSPDRVKLACESLRAKLDGLPPAAVAAKLREAGMVG